MDMFTQGMQVLFNYFLNKRLYLMGVKFGEDLRTNNIKLIYLERIYWSTSSNYTNYSTLELANVRI